MKILITGATGFIGSKLVHKLLEQNHEISVLTRDISKATPLFSHPRIRFYEWKNTQNLPPLDSIKDIEGVVNLMGENIGDKHWSQSQKTKLRKSRIDSTLNLINLIETNKKTNLKFFINASAIGIYPTHPTTIIDENSALGEGFLAGLCKDWEGTLNLLTKADRKVCIRTGVVLGEDGGALKKMLPLFKLGLGGKLGDGKQYMSWIHVKDLVNIYVEAINNSHYQGAYNAVAQNPVTNAEFTQSLGEALRKPTFFQVPAFALKMALGEMSSIVLDSQRIIPLRLNQERFHFEFQMINQAFAQLFAPKDNYVKTPSFTK